MDAPNIIGLTGALVAGGAYLPQISHLIKEKCSAGISRPAFALWFVSSLFVTVNAIFIDAMVFIFLGVIQLLCTAVIFIYSTKYKGKVCGFHLKHPESG